MIQIIAGTFGYFNGRKVIPITNADGPQKFDTELEARLVKEGVAKYVDASAAAPAEDPENPDPAGAPAPQDPDLPPPGDQPEGDPDLPPPGEQPDGDPGTPAGELPAYNEDMKLDELKAIAKVYGIDDETLKPMRAKKDVIAAIEAKKQEIGDDDEAPPQIAAADPV